MYFAVVKIDSVATCNPPPVSVSYHSPYDSFLLAFLLSVRLVKCMQTKKGVVFWISCFLRWTSLHHVS